MNTSPPRTSFSKMSLSCKNRPLRVLVLGQNSVGKTALIVRFITKRFIGEYESNLEKIYTINTIFDNEPVQFDILDAAHHLDQEENKMNNLEISIRWADAYILVYSVTDKCSFDECNRLRFLLNYNKRRRKLVTNNNRDSFLEVPVILVGNKNDQNNERMVSLDEGYRRYKEMSCVCFHEISVRESVDQVQAIFRDVFRFWRVFNKFSKLKRSSSDVNSYKTFCNLEVPTPLQEFLPMFSETHTSVLTLDKSRINKTNLLNEAIEDKAISIENSFNICSETLTPFRSRASTDGTILSRPKRWRYLPPGCVLTHSSRVERRMSISGRGSNISY